MSNNKYVKDKSEVVSHSSLKNRATETDAIWWRNCDGQVDGFKARKFALDDLVAATENFKKQHFLGEGGFGQVYKGHLQDTNEVS